MLRRDGDSHLFCKLQRALALVSIVGRIGFRHYFCLLTTTTGTRAVNGAVLILSESHVIPHRCWSRIRQVDDSRRTMSVHRDLPQSNEELERQDRMPAVFGVLRRSDCPQKSHQFRRRLVLWIGSSSLNALVRHWTGSTWFEAGTLHALAESKGHAFVLPDAWESRVSSSMNAW